MSLHTPIYANNSETQNLEANESEIQNSDANNVETQNSDGQVSEDIPVIKGNPNLPDDLQKKLKLTLRSNYMPLDIVINQKYLASKTDAFVFEGTSYISLRSLIELIKDSSITWNNDLLRADITLPNIKGQELQLSFYLNSTVYLNNGVAQQLPATTLLKEGNLMIPLKFISQLLDFTADYDFTYYIATLSFPHNNLDFTKLENRFYTVEEFKDFAKLLKREAGGTSYQALHAVGSVVSNHISHPYYPSTLHDVMYAKAPSGAAHFSPVHKSNFSSTIPDYNSVLAAKKVLRGENSAGSSIFFNIRPFRGKKIYKVINGIYFCY